MIYTSEAIERLVGLLSSLPSIGRKTAQRLTYYILRQDEDFIKKLSESLLDLKQKVKYCSECFNYTDSSPCVICCSDRRDESIICVVAEPNDVVAIEKTNDFRGRYHVLHGLLNPLEGVNVSDLKIKELIKRLQNVSEVILAINPSVEGEITIQYLYKIMQPLNIKITRIASGIPIGSAIEYSDEATLSRALEARVTVSNQN